MDLHSPPSQSIPPRLSDEDGDADRIARGDGDYLIQWRWLPRPIRIGETPLLMMLGAFVGVFTGLVTVLYRLAVHHGNRLLLEGVLNAEGAERMGWTMALRLLLPAGGALAVGLILRATHRPNALHGVPAILRAMQTGRFKLPFSMAVPSICSVGILATGGSAGPEGPIVEIGSVMGGNVGERFRLPARMRRALVASGVSAGIASVFNAPLAGVFFAIEVIMQEYRVAAFAPVVMASVLSSIVTVAFLGEVPPAIVAPAFEASLREIPIYCLMGVAMGALSIGFILCIDAAGRVSARIPAPFWIKPALGGLGVGAIGLLLPQVMGEGYSFLNMALARNAESLPPAFEAGAGASAGLLFLAIAIAKMAATSLTLGFGSPGGIFAPGVFVGVAGGLCLGNWIDAAVPGLISHPSGYGLVGMAGMISGLFNAPMTAIMIVLRLTRDNQHILLPLMATVALSVFVMHRWRNISVYTWTLRKMGLPWGQDDMRDPLLDLSVGDICSRDFLALSEGQTVQEALEALRQTDHTVFLVRSEQGKRPGVVSLADLRLAFQDREMSMLLTLGDLVDDSSRERLFPWASLRDGVRLFTRIEKEGVAVYRSEAENWPIGIVTRASILQAYRAQKTE